MSALGLGVGMRLDPPVVDRTCPRCHRTAEQHHGLCCCVDPFAPVAERCIECQRTANEPEPVCTCESVSAIDPNCPVAAHAYLAAVDEADARAARRRFRRVR